MSVASPASHGQLGDAAQPGVAPAAKARSARVIGVDVARGLALLGMFAAHIFDTLHDNNTPSLTHQVVGGHALATFVLLAGVSITFITKRGGTTSSRMTDAPTAAAMATRALIITLIGLLLNSAVDPDIQVILPYYGVMFVLAIPLLRLSSRLLVGISIGLVLVAPLVVLAGFSTELPDEEPTFATLLHPLELARQLVVTGEYPAVAFMAFICAGMAIGRLDLANSRVAIRLAVGGVVLAASSWVISSLILFRLGGLQHLRAAAASGLPADQAQNVILWDPEPVLSWWWLTQRAAFTSSPFRMVHDLGVAMAWLGLCLLITRLPVARWALSSVAAAGAMTLTLYTVHVILLSTPFLEDNPIELYAVMIYAALSFAVLWRRRGRRGPLETAVTRASDKARDMVQTRQANRRPRVDDD